MVFNNLEPLKIELLSFLSSVNGEPSQLVSGLEGKLMIMVAEAALESLKSKKVIYL